jgi:hypothetical protein
MNVEADVTIVIAAIAMAHNASDSSRIIMMNISHVMCCRNDEGVMRWGPMREKIGMIWIVCKKKYVRMV